MPPTAPTYTLERTLQHQGYKLVAGVDEVGRGPWAGPVVAAAVILHPQHLPAARDSKQLNATQRQGLYQAIKATAHIGVGQASVTEIDAFNIRAATFLAMQRALAALPFAPDFALIDGNALPSPLPCPAQAVVGGDAAVLSIAAASIVAKVTRDEIMQALHVAFPPYGWDTNVGYGTKHHQNGLLQHGVTEHHRHSFRPIRALLPQADTAADAARMDKPNTTC